MHLAPGCLPAGRTIPQELEQKMKAARWHGVKDIRVENVAEPSPGAGEVKVKVAWTGICGSDLHEYLAGPIFVPVEQDHPLSHCDTPSPPSWPYRPGLSAERSPRAGGGR